MRTTWRISNALFPALDEDLCRVKVHYVTLPGWMSDTSAARSFSELPQKAQDYVHKIQELVEVPGTCRATHLFFLYACPLSFDNVLVSRQFPLF